MKKVLLLAVLMLTVPALLCACGGGLRCTQFTGSTVSSHFLTRWYYHEKPRDDHQKMEWVAKDSFVFANEGISTLSAREWLSSSEALRLAGFSDQTVDDCPADAERGIVPRLLPADDVHYNSVGCALLGNRIFRQLYELGYFEPVFDYYESLES